MSIMHKLNRAKNYLMLFGAFSIIGLSSCTDDEPTTSGGDATIGGAFPTTAGSYWVFQNQEIDTNGVLLPEIIGFDSTIAGTSYSLDGKTAIDFTTYPGNINGQYDISDTAKTLEIYSKEGNIVYSSTNEILSDFAVGPFPINMGDISNVEKWIVAMQDKSSWVALDIPIEIEKLELPAEISVPFDLSLSGNIKMNGSKVKQENLIIDGKTYNTTKFEMSFNSSFTVNANVFNIKTKILSLTNPIKANVWIADGIGIVKKENLPFITSVDVNSTFSEMLKDFGLVSGNYKNNGTVSTILRYNVKK